MTTTVNQIPNTNSMGWVDALFTRLAGNKVQVPEQITFGGTGASFPMLKRNANAIESRLADDSGNCNFSCRTLLTYWSAGVSRLQIDTSGQVAIYSDGSVAWSNSTTNAAATKDLLLYRDAIGATVGLGQRNGTNAQAFRVYNTYTSSTNYEAFVIDWQTPGSNVCRIGTEKGSGGGTQRQLMIDAPSVAFGGSTSAFPMLKRSGTVLEAKLADDSALATINAKFSSGSILFSESSSGAVHYTISTVGGSASYGGNFGSSLLGISLPSANIIGWGGNTAASIDVRLYRDAAGILAQRNGTNAQAFRVYNTYTSSTNYEAFVIDWQTTANTCVVGCDKGSGGGTQRTMQLRGARRQITAAIDAPTAGQTTGSIVVPIGCTIVGYKLLAVGITGTATVDVWKKASAVPTVADTIVAAAPVTGSSVFTDSTTLTGWTTAIAANDVVKFSVTATGGATRLVVVLDLREA